VALDDLSSSKETKPIKITVDENLIKSRIFNIVNDYPNGLFESSIIEYYAVKHNEGLPKNWLTLVEKLITLDVGANNLTILSPKNNTNICSVSNAVTEPALLNLNNKEEFWIHIYIAYNTTDIWGVIIDENHSVSMI
jgi:hypothetical protein